MPKKESTFVNALLFSLYAAGAVAEQVLTVAFTSPYEWRRKVLHGGSYATYRANVYKLRNRGAIKIITHNGKKFLQLTEKGQLEILLAKARIFKPGKWDGKWRMMIFDIPESAKPQRNQFRRLLKKNHFVKLQASVYISPWALNRDAVSYLKEMGLMKFIRIIKVGEMDDDADLRKKFKLNQ